jgi:hypothetical protein
MSNEITIEAAIIEANRAANPDVRPTDYDRRAKAMATLIEASRFRIKRKPVPGVADEMDFYLCPNCKASVGIIDDSFDMNQESRFCYNCGQALDWSKE